MEQAEEFIRAFFDELKDVKRWIERVKRTVLEKGEVVSPFGRHRRLWGIFHLTRPRAMGTFSETTESYFRYAKAEIFRQAVNALIQGSASDVLSLASIRVQRRLKEEGIEAALVFTHHDALYLEASPESVVQAVKVLKEEMERPVPQLNNGVFPVEWGVGRCWGDESCTEEVLDMARKKGVEL